MRLKDEDKNLISRCIHELEARTEAEVALVVRQKSGGYRDVSYFVGAVAAFLALAFALFSPWVIHPLAIPMPIVAVFWGAGWLCGRSRLRVLLTTRKRRRDQVAKAAAAAFYEKKVFETDGRTGVLIYYSHFERQALILPDRGARARLDPARLEEYRAELARIGESKNPVRALGTFLRSFGVYLERAIPWDETKHGSKENQLSNEPDTLEEDE